MNRHRTWTTQGNLRGHFRKHGRKLRLTTEAHYEASALATIQLGAPFTFEQDGVPRIGYYHRATNRLTVVTDDDLFIVTHFPPDRSEQYCRDLAASTYP